MSARRAGLVTKPTPGVRLLPAVVLLLVSHAGAAAQAPAPAPRLDAQRVHLAALPPVAAAGDAVALGVSDSPPPHGVGAPVRPSAGRGRSHALAGAGIGLVAGAAATYAVLHSGGSTSRCDRSANQDALAPRECLGLAALGGLAGAGLGAVVGAQIRTGSPRAFSFERRRVAVAPLPARGVGLALAVAF